MWDFKILGVSLYFIFFYFAIFCFFGVIIEMLFCLSKEGIFESRQGTLYLPLSPVYGIGGTVLTVLLLGKIDSPILLFLSSIILGSIVEYIASFVMEKLFHAKFWDYSHLPYNLHGRICLQYSFYWGFLGLFLMYLIVPDIYNHLMALFSKETGKVIATILLPIFILTFAITLIAFNRLKQKINFLKAKLSGNEKVQIKNNVFWNIIDTIAPEKLIIWTFPNMSLVVEVQKLEGKKSQKEIKIEKYIDRLNSALEKYRNLA